MRGIFRQSLTLPRCPLRSLRAHCKTTMPPSPCFSSSFFFLFLFSSLTDEKLGYYIRLIRQKRNANYFFTCIINVLQFSLHNPRYTLALKCVRGNARRNNQGIIVHAARMDFSTYISKLLRYPLYPEERTIAR